MTTPRARADWRTSPCHTQPRSWRGRDREAAPAGESWDVERFRALTRPPPGLGAKDDVSGWITHRLESQPSLRAPFKTLGAGPVVDVCVSTHREIGMQKPSHEQTNGPPLPSTGGDAEGDRWLALPTETLHKER